MSEAQTVDDLVETGSEHLFHMQVPPNLKYFDGHFEGQPILAAVVQLEVVILPRIERLWPDLGTVERATKMKFRSPIRAGDMISLRLSRKHGQNKVRIAMIRDEEECASGTLSFT